MERSAAEFPAEPENDCYALCDVLSEVREVILQHEPWKAAVLLAKIAELVQKKDHTILRSDWHEAVGAASRRTRTAGCLVALHEGLIKEKTERANARAVGMQRPTSPRPPAGLIMPRLCSDEAASIRRFARQPQPGVRFAKPPTGMRVSAADNVPQQTSTASGSRSRSASICSSASGSSFGEQDAELDHDSRQARRPIGFQSHATSMFGAAGQPVVSEDRRSIPHTTPLTRRVRNFERLRFFSAVARRQLEEGPEMRDSLEHFRHPLVGSLVVAKGCNDDMTGSVRQDATTTPAMRDTFDGDPADPPCSGKSSRSAAALFHSSLSMAHTSTKNMPEGAGRDGTMTPEFRDTFHNQPADEPGTLQQESSSDGES
eukprot:TRINITY_DN13526_c0_g1_i3.p1 TRINITY_DN13526_c0_g1~~TRINITY_DN13526_c0_g1_i3.p1  ORF type:complete len:373 (-),score=29.45 TRINITY_DN13526_c0_g1_i3:423-1541(-)